MHAEMRELGGKGHGFIVPPDPGTRNGKGARLAAAIRYSLAPPVMSC